MKVKRTLVWGSGGSLDSNYSPSPASNGISQQPPVMRHLLGARYCGHMHFLPQLTTLEEICHCFYFTVEGAKLRVVEKLAQVHRAPD